MTMSDNYRSPELDEIAPAMYAIGEAMGILTPHISPESNLGMIEAFKTMWLDLYANHPGAPPWTDSHEHILESVRSAIEANDIDHLTRILEEGT